MKNAIGHPTHSGRATAAVLGVLAWPLLVIALCALLCNRAHAQQANSEMVVGLHLYTLHSRHTYLEEPRAGQPAEFGRFRSVTPGAYLRWGAGPLAGLTLGVLSNSFGDPSAYAAWTAETRAAGLPLGTQAAITLGGIVGYRYMPIVPLMVPSVRVPLAGDVSLRLSLLLPNPKSDHPQQTWPQPAPAPHKVSELHMSVEWRL